MIANTAKVISIGKRVQALDKRCQALKPLAGDPVILVCQQDQDFVLFVIADEERAMDVFQEQMENWWRRGGPRYLEDILKKKPRRH
ncbi:MAG: hypothetical protein LBU67_02690 [Oscillospiraceae bacterium]|jgi:hypothetical protein|nr:hypothetical protein [Oscillospiraceae bacterium]